MPEIKKGQCEHCKKHVGVGVIDYCAICGKDLCDGCMLQGCCGNIPAKSGSHEDFSEETEG